jgi:hypothetical protein
VVTEHGDAPLLFEVHKQWASSTAASGLYRAHGRLTFAVFEEFQPQSPDVHLLISKFCNARCTHKGNLTCSSSPNTASWNSYHRGYFLQTSLTLRTSGAIHLLPSPVQGDANNQSDNKNYLSQNATPLGMTS